MKAFTFLVLGLAASGLADEQFHGNPLHVYGDYKSFKNQTTFTITLKNVTNKPITDIEIRRAGLWIHSRDYRPPLRIASIPAKGRREIIVTVRGFVAGGPVPCRDRRQRATGNLAVLLLVAAASSS